ncbi:MAG TPA: acyl-CoA dehydrogenase family protein [Mycobacteriales bacterium]|nr:acyl-CoA dehydrogenase family protein [Mycobacteriales bacterium]
MDAETAALLRTSLREVFATDPPDVAAALAELGWDDVEADDEAAATRLLFEVHGEARAATAALERTVRSGLALAADVTIAWPNPTAGARPSSALAGDRVDVRGIALRSSTGPLAVPTPDGVVLVDGASVAREPVRGIDPDAGWIALDGSAAVTAKVAGEWAAVVPGALRALASELVGVSRATLALATAHVTSREQFGRPIGSYQSVRHRLAEAYAAIAGAEALVADAWLDGGAGAAATAKAVAGWAHADVARHALQVCGAMGVSWEHDLHRFVKRGYALDALLGSARVIAREQGGALLAGAAPVRVAGPAL